MTLMGKGFYIWKVRDCEGGDVNKIASAAVQAGLTHVLIKIANGTVDYNVDPTIGADYAASLAAALRTHGIQPWGWHYVYGSNPAGEASQAIERINATGVEGYVIDAEAEYKQPGRKDAAVRFMSQLRASLPNFPMALSSYRYPSYHPTLPWKEFLEKVDYNMPQVYWMKAHNAGVQLSQSLKQFQAITPFRPIIPTGAAFGEWGWKPTTAEVRDFLQTARTLNLTAANFWEWKHARHGSLPGIWDEIAAFAWDGPIRDIVEEYMIALNSHDAALVAGLYSPTGIHVSRSRTIQGVEAISRKYLTLFRDTLPNAVFTLSGFSGSGIHRHLNWTAASPKGKVENGSDTFGLINGKIAYHYSFYTVTN